MIPQRIQPLHENKMGTKLWLDKLATPGPSCIFKLKGDKSGGTAGGQSLVQVHMAGLEVSFTKQECSCVGDCSVKTS